MNLGLIGCGKMGRALLEGALKAGQIAAKDCIVHDRYEAAQSTLARELGTQSANSPSDTVVNADIILLCTKPADMLTMLAGIQTSSHPLFFSIAAGLSTTQLESALPEGARVIRCMPNTPALIGEGASAFCRGRHATEKDAALVLEFMRATGTASEVTESLLDAVTGLSGSGPAYVYTFIEALTDAGVAEGLPRDIALQLALQTVQGSAKMVAQTGLHPAVLRDQVTSPGGTTIEALTSLEEDGFRTATINAVRTAAEKSRTLGT